MRSSSETRCTQRSLFLGLLSVCALVACDEAQSPPIDLSAPDAASAAEGTGDSAPTEAATDEKRHAAMAFFTGYANPEEGVFEVELVDRESWQLAVWDDADGRYRTTGQPLNDFCEAAVSRFLVNSFTLDTVANTTHIDEDCPRDGAFPYGPFGRAYCAQVRLQSNYIDPINNVYAEIVRISDTGFSMYTRAFYDNFGLGNGAAVPTTTGNNTPTDANGGLVHYGDFAERYVTRDEWWVFRRPSDSDFFFGGIIVYEALEIDDDIDNDCDGLIDEDTATYPDGEICYSDGDCVGGTCDCGADPCTTGESPTCRTPYCGDGITEGLEECDPNAVGGETATCDPDCTFTVCGDDYLNVTAGESCDPGTVGGFTATCDSDCTPAACPDGLLNTEAGEVCDDGNTSNTDACLNDCTEPFCGDGHTRTGLASNHPDYEQCDDANSDNSDGCIDCRFALCGDGWVLSGSEDCDGDGAGTGGETATCDQDCTPAVCGDGNPNTTAGETCDTAGNTITCDVDCSTPVCGDGLTNGFYTAPGAPGPEQCDLGSATNANNWSCTAHCRNARCGDGFRRVDITNPADPSYEECDDGASNSNTTPGACRTSCRAAFCGDDVVDPGENCDQGPLNSDIEPGFCRLDCTNFGCGDGVVDPANPSTGAPAEECDDPAGNSNSIPDRCRTNCTAPRCGDGVQDSGEQCDDGNASNDDSCLVGCIAAVCGDGYIEAGVEQCDDGNTNNNDGCSSVCGTETGWVCPSAGAACVPNCGDGLVRGTEQCDDGNNTSGDGCSATCGTENGWTCPSEGATCFTTCGDGVRAGTEYCDTQVNTAGCDAGDCTAPACGDNYRNAAAGEVCDDGNTNYADNCLGDCSANAACGDGWVRTQGASPEQCDGNGSGAGGQTASCDVDCTFAVCGDGYRNTNAGETCDDGAANSDTAANACRTNCQVATCGDGVRDSGEQCDQGTLNSNTIANRCRVDCRNPYCGDGVRDSGEQCDGTSGVSGSQLCESNCTIDNDGDGYTVAEGDCDDSNSGIHPGAAESSDIFDRVDSNCDDHNFAANDSTIRIVQATSCTGSPLGSRCYQQTTSNSGLQNAINASPSNGRVLVRDNVIVPNPVTLRNGVDVFGGWQTNWDGWDGGSAGGNFRSQVRHNTSSASTYHAVFHGFGLSTLTEIAYLDIEIHRNAQSGDVSTLHALSATNSDGLYIHHNNIYAGPGFDGANSNQGDIASPPGPGAANNECEWFSCADRTNGGQGNGWRVYQPNSSTSFFYAGNSALHGGAAGGSSIGVMLSHSSEARLESNNIQATQGGRGGSVGSRGGQGGHSFSVYFHGEAARDWTVSAAGGSPVDCASNQRSNVMSYSSAGIGGNGTDWARGRNGAAGRCHFQSLIFEFSRSCSYASPTSLDNTSNHHTMRDLLPMKGRCQ